MQLGTWKGQVDFLVASMDDFNLVIGLKLMRKIYAISLPYANSLCILNKESLCMVPGVAPDVKKKGTMPLSTMQLAKGVKKGEATFLAVMKMEPAMKEHDEDMPQSIKAVLEENRDVMPLELPKSLLPMREVDYNIELELGAKPPAMAPYCLAPPELEKLRKNSQSCSTRRGYVRRKHHMEPRYCSRASTMGRCGCALTTEC